MEWYYDNLSAPLKDEPEFVEVERVYCFDWDQFTDVLWRQLSDTFEAMPDRMPASHDGCPWWFGTDEERHPFLWASREPSGLQVYGVIKPADWSAWDHQFRQLTEALPKRDIG
jgi:hypothetical protein